MSNPKVTDPRSSKRDFTPYVQKILDEMNNGTRAFRMFTYPDLLECYDLLAGTSIERRLPLILASILTGPLCVRDPDLLDILRDPSMLLKDRLIATRDHLVQMAAIHGSNEPFSYTDLFRVFSSSLTLDGGGEPALTVMRSVNKGDRGLNDPVIHSLTEPGSPTPIQLKVEALYSYLSFRSSREG